SRPRSTADVDVGHEQQQQAVPEGSDEVGARERMAGVLGARQRLGSELLYRTSQGRQGTAPAERLEAQRQHATRHLQLRKAGPADTAAADQPGGAQAVADEGMSG